MKLKAKVTIIDNKTGKVDLEFESKSWVIQFPQLLAANFMASEGLAYTFNQIRDTGNILRTYAVPSAAPRGYFDSSGGAGIVTHGIVVGSGAGAENPLQYQLGTLIAHGIGAGELQYGGMSFVEAYIIGTVIYFDLQRIVTNGSPGDVTIREIGIYTRNTFGANVWYFMIIRDLLAAPVVIGAGTNKTIKYTISCDNAA